MTRIHLLISLLWITSLCAATVSAKSLHEQGCKLVFEEAWTVDEPDVSHQKQEHWDSKCWDYLSDDRQRWIGSQSSSESTSTASSSSSNPMVWCATDKRYWKTKISACLQGEGNVFPFKSVAIANVAAHRRLKSDSSTSTSTYSSWSSNPMVWCATDTRYWKTKRSACLQGEGNVFPFKSVAIANVAAHRRLKSDSSTSTSSSSSSNPIVWCAKKSGVTRKARRACLNSNGSWHFKWSYADKEYKRLTLLSGYASSVSAVMVWCATAETSIRSMNRGKCLANGGKGFNTYTAARTEQRRLTTDVSYRLEEAKKHKAKKDKAKKDKAKKDKAKKEKERQLRKEREVKEARQRNQTEFYSAIGGLVGRISAKVRENWNKPLFSIRGLETVVSVKVQRTGEVVSVKVVKSSGNDYFDQSAENAVYKASPLPFPDEPRYYEFLKEFDFKFAPDESNVYSGIVLPNSDPVVWCASKSGVTLENRSSCISNAGGPYASEDQANREHHRLKRDVSNKLERGIPHLGGTYNGQVVNGVPHGQGTFSHPDGGNYVGEWKNGRQDGQGTWGFFKGQLEGLQIVGEWKNGELHGQGTMTIPSGEKYVGDWKATKLHGHGTYTWPNGQKYVGTWKNGKRDGYGTYTWSDGRKYVGEWKANERHGHGTSTYPSGGKYVGEWRNHSPWEGTRYNNLGNVTATYSEGVNSESPKNDVLHELKITKECSKCDLSGQDLSGLNLSQANLRKANLSQATIRGTTLSGANLNGANLSKANLEGVNLSRANLQWANLSGAKLQDTTLVGVKLLGANLSGAKLQDTTLSGATLCRTIMPDHTINNTGCGFAPDVSTVSTQDSSSSNSNQIVWCANSERIWSILKAGVCGKGAKRFTSKAAADEALKSPAMAMVWCARATGVTYESGEDCRSNSGLEFFTTLYTEAKAAHHRLKSAASSAAIPTVWCATADSVSNIPRQQCHVKQGLVFSSREKARAERQRLRVVSLEKQIKQTENLLKKQKEVTSRLQQEQTITGKLTIRSNVRGDKVYIDGVHKGSTRLDLDLPKGSHIIRIEKEGYKAYEKEINLVDTVKLRATLERLPSQVRHALVIGNSKYTNSPLKNPKNDAEDLAAALRSIGFSVNQLTDASRTEMRHAIRDFGNKLAVNRDSTGLFFYAGHGVQSKGTNFLIPIGADINKAYELSDEAVRAESVIGSMDEAGNQMNIIILDACRNNPYRSLFRGGTRGLKQMQASRGMWIAFSTAPGELSVDGEGRNSPYTRHLIEAIKTPGLSIEQVFKTVRRGVIEDTLEEQIPWDQTSITGDFYFTGAPE